MNSLFSNAVENCSNTHVYINNTIQLNNNSFRIQKNYMRIKNKMRQLNKKKQCKDIITVVIQFPTISHKMYLTVMKG